MKRNQYLRRAPCRRRRRSCASCVAYASFLSLSLTNAHATESCSAPRLSASQQCGFDNTQVKMIWCPPSRASWASTSEDLVRGGAMLAKDESKLKARDKSEELDSSRNEGSLEWAGPGHGGESSDEGGTEDPTDDSDFHSCERDFFREAQDLSFVFNTTAEHQTFSTAEGSFENKGTGQSSHTDLHQKKNGDNSQIQYGRASAISNISSPTGKGACDDVASVPQASYSKPLRTLKKLQAMLDETDYATSTMPRKKPSILSGKQTKSSNSNEGPQRVVEGNNSANLSPGYQSNEYGVEDEIRNNLSPGATESFTNAVVPSKLWSSEDRAKYRRQQQFRSIELEHRRREELENHRLAWKEGRLNLDPHCSNTQSSTSPGQKNIYEDEQTDSENGFDYTLPNLPIYMSDSEPVEFDPIQTTGTPSKRSKSETDNSTTTDKSQVQTPNRNAKDDVTSFSSKSGPNSHRAAANDSWVQTHGPYPRHPQVQQYKAAHQGYSPMQWQHQQRTHLSSPYQQQTLYHGQPYLSSGSRSQEYMTPPGQNYAGYHSGSSAAGMHPPTLSGLDQSLQHRTQYPQATRRPGPITTSSDVRRYSKASSASQQLAYPGMPITGKEGSLSKTTNHDKMKSKTNTGMQLSFDSVQKLVFLSIGVVLLSYSAVSPRTAETVDYITKVKQNLRTASLISVVPFLVLLSIIEAKESDINSIVTTFYHSCVSGYMFAFGLEIALTTVVRLLVFAVWEPEIYQLTPRVPLIMLPWTLRESLYRPRRITLFSADFLASCVVSPFVEEGIKLKILQSVTDLPRNFRLVKRKSKTSVQKRKKRARRGRILEPVVQEAGAEQAVGINTYVAHMMASSLGLKLADNIRRSMMYTKREDTNQGFYALMRGIFPIHELCGTLTALQLARRDVLGLAMPLWRILFPAALLHGMANFRGMKPIFKWNSSTPWSEMQMSPWKTAEDSSFLKVDSKTFSKMMWITIMGRVLGYCIKNYYMVCRQAIKRTTTYALNQAAFSAELEAADLLKKTKADK
jgi:hypothetical protein